MWVLTYSSHCGIIGIWNLMLLHRKTGIRDCLRMDQEKDLTTRKFHQHGGEQHGQGNMGSCRYFLEGDV